MEPGTRAVGVRLEHPQHLIDCLRYRSKTAAGATAGSRIYNADKGR